ncbi:MAG: class I SAM-dependent methyltransferase, partial [Candidatus Saccharibacteria bacterium]|nr:class I SAM-dependent methyltransferase [Candidatus Saccharibacteria bacterium]
MVDSKAWDWNKVKGDHEKYWQEPAIESYYLINRWLAQNKKDFLDLGCGLGRHTIQFAKAGFNTFGFDLSETSIRRTEEYAKETGVKVELLVGDMLSLPYSDDSFDCVYCRNVISHTDTAGMRKIVAELKRILREGGECYLTLGSKQTWGFKQDWPVVDENTKIRVEDGPENGIPHFYADYDLIVDLFKDFEIIKVFQVEGYITRERTTSSFHYHV